MLNTQFSKNVEWSLCHSTDGKKKVEKFNYFVNEYHGAWWLSWTSCVTLEIFKRWFTLEMESILKKKYSKIEAIEKLFDFIHTTKNSLCTTNRAESINFTMNLKI